MYDKNVSHAVRTSCLFYGNADMFYVDFHWHVKSMGQWCESRCLYFVFTLHGNFQNNNATPTMCYNDCDWNIDSGKWSFVFNPLDTEFTWNLHNKFIYKFTREINTNTSRISHKYHGRYRYAIRALLPCDVCCIEKIVCYLRWFITCHNFLASMFVCPFVC